MLNVLYHIVMEMKIRESSLQTGTFIYKPGISVTKSIPMTRKAVVLDIRIILVNSVLHAKQKGFAEQAVHTNLLTNAACALNAPYIVLIL